MFKMIIKYKTFIIQYIVISLDAFYIATDFNSVGLLQLKYPLNSISEQNSVLWLGNTRKLIADPRLESVGKLQRDMELVYVGQVCLSWEILQWQLRKAIELQRHDLHGICQYNQVASEFQLFKVVLKKFMEEERFQGNRVENYVQNRCVFRSLLQVPPIKGRICNIFSKFWVLWGSGS